MQEITLENTLKWQFEGLQFNSSLFFEAFKVSLWKLICNGKVSKQ